MVEQKDDVAFYTVWDPKKKEDMGGRYKGYSPSAAAAKAAKSDYVFPDRKNYPAKTFWIRKLDNKRLEPTLYCYTATQKMVPATKFIKEQSGNSTMRKVEVHPCKQ